MTEPQGTIAFEHLGIAAALSHHRFAVPPNQRDYAWQDEHVVDLLQDLSRAIDVTPATYFLGTIVLTIGPGDRPEVSDGQQRLATTTILLAAIRDHLVRTGEETRAQSIEQEYLRSIDFDTEDIVPKLRLNVDDDEFFRRSVLPRPGDPERDVEPSRDSHRRLRRASELAAEHVANVVSVHKPAEQARALGRWIEFLRTGAQVILLTVPNHLNAFVMFETLNDRGLRASEADLLKNYLLRQAGSRIDEARQKWAKMLGVLESISAEDITVTYLRHVLITQYGPTKEREIYARVQGNVTGSGKALQFVAMLADSVNTYAALFNPEHPKWNDEDESVRRALLTMIELGVEQIRPLMFAVALRSPPEELQKAFRLFVSWSVRFLIVGGRGGLLDRNYALAAQEVGTGRIANAEDLARYMSGIVPGDAEFIDSFAVARVSQTRLARYYLRTLEYALKESAQPEIEAVRDKATLNLEHVLPESPEGNWPDIEPEVASALYRRLGNMVLLHARKNSSIGNKPFADKREHLSSSPLALTAEVGRKRTWGAKEISDRQKRLAELAIKTWPLG